MMTKKGIEEILVKYINHVIDIEGIDFIDERYLYAANFTEKEKTYLMKISKLKQR
jgi:hypothetical protein